METLIEKEKIGLKVKKKERKYNIFYNYIVENV